MSKLPPIPPEQRYFKNDQPNLADDTLREAEHGNKDVNLDQQGQTANTRQNTTAQRSVQDR